MIIKYILSLYRMSVDNTYNEKLNELNNSLDILNQTIQKDQSKNKKLVNHLSFFKIRSLI